MPALKYALLGKRCFALLQNGTKPIGILLRFEKPLSYLAASSVLQFGAELRLVWADAFSAVGCQTYHVEIVGGSWFLSHSVTYILRFAATYSM